MAHPIDHLIEPMTTGVKVKLKSIYFYPDGHGFLQFEDGTSWPFSDTSQAIGLISLDLVRKMHKTANRFLHEGKIQPPKS